MEDEEEEEEEDGIPVASFIGTCIIIIRQYF